MIHDSLRPVIQMMRDARNSVATMDRMPNDDDADALNAIRSEAVDIIRTYVDACMKNAIFTISTAHPDTKYLEFSVTYTDKARVHVTAVSEDGRVFKHENIDVVEGLINNFVSKSFSSDETFEFFDKFKVMYSGVIKGPSSINSASPKAN